jgi:modulator of FtsH protease HflK
MNQRFSPLRDPLDDGGGAPERRSTSVQLRDGRPDSAVSGSDTANQSIADALKISFFLLKIGMLTLGVLYVLSGFQFVKEGEQGIRLLFGKVEDARVEPGFRYSWPFPLGEMVRVETGANRLKVDKEFWVEMSAGDEIKTVDQLAATQSLKPNDSSGSLLTADGNIAHARVTSLYRRAVPGDAAKNLYPGEDEKAREEEVRIVRLAIQRGVVQAVARVSIDDLLKQSSSDEGGVAEIAKRIAQDMLDGLQSGLVVDSLTLEPIAPLFVRADFAKVQAAVSIAARTTEEARLDAQRELNAAAGSAAAVLIEAINAYESSITVGNQQDQTTALATIHSVLDQGAATWNGKDVQLAGEASRLMSTARQYHTEIVAKRRGQLDAFNAKLALYESNPSVMIQREWASATRDFYARDNVEIFMMYPGIGTLAMKLNRDQDISREQIRTIKERQTQEATDIRNAEWQRTKYETKVEPKAQQ